MKKEKKIRVGISVGDLNGIGAEIILKIFNDSRMLDFCTPVIFASIKTMAFVKKHFKLQVHLHGINQMTEVVDGKVNVLNCWKEHVNIKFGIPNPEIGAYAIKSLTTATKALKENQIDTLVTAPINKHNIQSETFSFPGHTDYLAKELGGNSLMLMLNDTLRIGLLTDHVPLKEVSTIITEKLIIEKIKTIHTTLKQDFQIPTPKIAVLGLNPHTGDNGVIGSEDDMILRPTLKKIKDSGILVFGPYAADSFFGTTNYKKFDAIIATYHDQGLIPFKTLSFGEGVNFTSGLSHVRTSPDHGTAYDIAGKDKADTNSFKEALFTSIKIYNNRKEYLELTEKSLNVRR